MPREHPESIKLQAFFYTLDLFYLVEAVLTYLALRHLVRMKTVGAVLCVLLPMAVPILMVVFVLAFIGTIIEYPVASVLLREEPNLTLAVGSKFYLYDQKYLWGDFAAAAVLSGLPITLVFLAAQRWIVSGLTSGGVKG